MTNIFYIMGKSATGKDTIYKKIKENIEIKEYILYTTRPIRVGEKDGVNYHFTTHDEIENCKQQGKVIESRTYNTVQGPWTYATIDDEQLKQQGNILTVGTLESYIKMKKYYENNTETKVIPIYIHIDEDERRKRAIEREKEQEKPDFAEVERRLKADNIDFSEENLKNCNITQKETFKNYDLEKCVNEILKYIKEKSAEI